MTVMLSVGPLRGTGPLAQCQCHPPNDGPANLACRDSIFVMYSCTLGLYETATASGSGSFTKASVLSQVA